MKIFQWKKSKEKGNLSPMFGISKPFPFSRRSSFTPSVGPSVTQSFSSSTHRRSSLTSSGLNDDDDFSCTSWMEAPTLQSSVSAPVLSFNQNANSFSPTILDRNQFSRSNLPQKNHRWNLRFLQKKKGASDERVNAASAQSEQRSATTATYKKSSTNSQHKKGGPKHSHIATDHNIPPRWLPSQRRSSRRVQGGGSARSSPRTLEECIQEYDSIMGIEDENQFDMLTKGIMSSWNESQSELTVATSTTVVVPVREANSDIEMDEDDEAEDCSRSSRDTLTPLVSLSPVSDKLQRRKNKKKLPGIYKNSAYRKPGALVGTAGFAEFVVPCPAGRVNSGAQLANSHLKFKAPYCPDTMLTAPKKTSTPKKRKKRTSFTMEPNVSPRRVAGLPKRPPLFESSNSSVQPLGSKNHHSTVYEVMIHSYDDIIPPPSGLKRGNSDSVAASMGWWKSA